MRLRNGLKYWLVIDGQCSDELYTFQNNIMINGKRRLRCTMVSNKEETLKVVVDGMLVEAIPAVTPGKYMINGKKCTIKRSKPYPSDRMIQSVEIEGHSDAVVMVNDADSKQYSVVHMNGKAEVWQRRSSSTMPIVACVCSFVLFGLIVGVLIAGLKKRNRKNNIDWTKRQLVEAGIQPDMNVNT